MESIVDLKTKNELSKWTENQTTQSTRDVKKMCAHCKGFHDNCEEIEGVPYKAELF